MRALARNPDERYPSAAALLDALEGHLARRSDGLTMRDVGGLVSAVFAEERRRTSAVIEETMSRVRGSHPRSGIMLTLEGQTRGTPSHTSRLLPTPGTILNSLQPLAANDPEPAPLPPLLDRLRAQARRAPAMVAAVAALVVLLVFAIAASTGDDGSRGAHAGAATTRVREARAPRSVVDVALQGPIDPDADHPSAPAVRWFGVRAAPSRPTRHSSAPATSSIDPPAPPPQAPPPAPAPEVVAPVGHAPLRPIITNNPYGNP
jgi:hypothetical protein